MTSTLIDARELEPYTPLTDPRRRGKPGIMTGKNFLFDADGPRSAYDTEFYNWFQFGKGFKEKINEFRVEDEYFYGTPTGIWRIMEVSLEPELLLSVNVVPYFKFWPWTFAKVGGLYYFAQHDVGLWQYSPETKKWVKVVTPAIVLGICESYGRLICLSDTTVFWSALDDGTNLIPSVTTGAGFQALSILSRNAFRVDGVANGFIVSTDKGYLKGEFVAANYVFRFYVLSRQMKPFSPNASIVVPDIGLLTLDPAGFHVTNGQLPTAWEADIGEYFSKTYLLRMDRRRFGCVCLYYSYSYKALFVQFAPNEREGSYTETFVYFLPSGKWGVLNKTHHGLFEIIQRPQKIEAAAFMDMDGFIEKFTNKRDCETFFTAPLALLDYIVRKFEEPTLRNGGPDSVIVGVTDLWWGDIGPTFLANTIAQTGLFGYKVTDFSEGASLAFAGNPEPLATDPAWYTVI